MEIDPTSLNSWLNDSTRKNPVLIDCREVEEHAICKIENSELIPLNELAASIENTDYHSNDDIVVYCHHGIRSLHAVQYMRAKGFNKTLSLSGGIERWASEIDQTILRY